MDRGMSKTDRWRPCDPQGCREGQPCPRRQMWKRAEQFHRSGPVTTKLHLLHHPAIKTANGEKAASITPLGKASFDAVTTVLGQRSGEPADHP
jgi:hypothetical protein